MKVPLSLLLRFCDPGLEPEEIASVLALSGTEVERVTRLGVSDQSNLVVGSVLSADPHPDADRLRVCSVDVGSDEPSTIVCGAPNVSAGQMVAVALPGAVIAGGMEIGVAKLRGVESAGMICAEDELGLGSGHEGILELPSDSGPAGRPLAEVLPLSETVLELEITPNRPDCLGVYGVARELHAATGAALAPPPWDRDTGSEGDLEGFSLEVDVPGKCPMFSARIYEVPSGRSTPREIAWHLTAAGMRPISPVVDITNYVMLLVGEPLHAFDLDAIAGARLTVRGATDGESITTLDGQERELVQDDIVICDADGPASIAGVMGGARSEVTESTTRVLLEAAVWDGPSIHSTSTRLGLRSEASGRFEKGLAPELAERGQACASVLFEQVFGVEPLPGTAVAGGPAGRVTVALDQSRVSALLGSDIDEARITAPLVALGFEIAGDGGGMEVTVPPDRRDVSRPVDLIEEIARIDGLDRIPDRVPGGGTQGGGLKRGQILRRRIEDRMVAAGCFEIAGWSFAAPSIADRLRLAPDDHRREAVTLRNPMSLEESQMRTTLLGSLIEAAGRNAARGVTATRLFELGPVYLPREDGMADEPLRLACLLHGPAEPQWWGAMGGDRVSVHSAAGVLASVLDRFHLDWSIEPETETEPFLQPGRGGRVVVAGGDVGWIGDLHPEVASGWGLDHAAAFEVDAEAILAAAPEVLHYVELSPYPAVIQDLSLVVPEGIPASSLVAAARTVAAPELEDVRVFDVYGGGESTGEPRSIGLRLVFRSSDRTLTEEEASRLRAAIVDQLEQLEGVRARG